MSLQLFYQLYAATNGDASGDKVGGKCERTDVRVFYEWLLLPSSVVVICLMFLAKRRTLWPDFLNGYFAVVTPSNFGVHNRVAYAAAYGLAADLVINLLQGDMPVTYDGPKFLEVFAKLATMLIYGLAVYPVFACLTVGTFFSLSVGCLYSWVYFSMIISFTSECSREYELGFHLLWFLVPKIPQFICTSLICAIYPWKMVKSFKKWYTEDPKTPYSDLVFKPDPGMQQAFEDEYVRLCLKQTRNEAVPVSETHITVETPLDTIAITVVEQVESTRFYQVIRGFRYSSRIISTYTVALVTLFWVTYYIAFRGVAIIIGGMLKALQDLITQVKDTRDISDVYQSYDRAMGNETLLKINEIRKAYHYFSILQVIIILALVASCIIQLVQMVLGLKAYRRDVLKCRRGEFTKVDLPREGTNIMVSFIQHAGYQIAYIYCGYLVLFSVILTLLSFLAFLVYLPLVYGQLRLFVELLETYWPMFILGYIIKVSRWLGARFIFLEDKGKVFALNNGRIFFCFTFFLFFYDILLGAFDVLMRLMKAIGWSVLNLSRLDVSLFPTNVSGFDPGFASYVGMIHFENMTTNPIVCSFVNILCHKQQSSLIDGRGDVARARFGVGASPARVDPRNRWMVAYTLVRNRKLIQFRKTRINREGRQSACQQNDFSKDVTKFMIKSLWPF